MHTRCNCSRRDFLARGLYGLGIGAGLPLILSRTSAALTAEALRGTSVEKHPERILVVVELSGGNDGLNTVVPFTDPAYYRARPKLGIREREVLKASDTFGFHPAMVGFERLYKDGLLGIVHGCGYDHPSLSHFSSMGFWHTGVPNGGDSYGWLGRLADRRYDTGSRNMIVNVGPLIAAAIWTILAGVWFAQFWIAQAPGRRPMTRQDRFRWLAIPVALGLVFALTRTDAVKEARFGLSRGALDEMAANVMAGGPLERGWVGLYDVGTVERTANGFWFVLADDGLARIGIAYAPTGEPIESDANYSPLWQAALFEHLDGPWWAFAQGWD